MDDNRIHHDLRYFATSLLVFWALSLTMFVFMVILLHCGALGFILELLTTHRGDRLIVDYTFTDRLVTLICGAVGLGTVVSLVCGVGCGCVFAHWNTRDNLLFIVFVPLFVILISAVFWVYNAPQLAAWGIQLIIAYAMFQVIVTTIGIVCARFLVVWPLRVFLPAELCVRIRQVFLV